MTQIGHGALITAVLISLLQMVVPMFLLRVHHELAWQFSRYSALSSCFLLLIALLSLMVAYVGSDFSITNVFLNSHSQSPLLYKITGVWGNHEGSMLLWVLLLSLYGGHFAMIGGKRLQSHASRSYVLVCMGMILLCLCGYVLLVSSPFETMSHIAAEGRDLNPILQDPALAIHPPILYMGYVGFALPFSLIFSGLMTRSLQSDLLKLVHQYGLIAWCFLTLGIALGSFWAYYELGWGGWWSWDPVENASLMPWLLGTALLHSVSVAINQKSLLRWVALLSILTFTASMAGTFLVRSGVLSSVHSFASDPERGVFMLLAMLIITGVALFLYGLRSHALMSQAVQDLMSRGGAIIINNLLLGILALTIFLGTVYPLFLEVFYQKSVSVGAPYFKQTVVPITIPLLILMGGSVFLKWRQKKWAEIYRKLRYILSLTLLTAIGLAYFLQVSEFFSGLYIVLALWIFYAHVAQFCQKGNVSVKNIVMIVVHIGFSVSLMGMGLDSLMAREGIVAVKPGQKIQFSDFTFHFQGVTAHKAPTYNAHRAHLVVYKESQKKADLMPEKRFYQAHQTLTTETSLYFDGVSIVYSALGSVGEDGSWSLRLYHHPYVVLIWIGALIMVLGGMLGTVTFRRKRY